METRGKGTAEGEIWATATGSPEQRARVRGRGGAGYSLSHQEGKDGRHLRVLLSQG